jgi:hypothetical protein
MFALNRWWARLAMLVVLAAGLPRAGVAQVCVGDCNGDGMVTIDELTRGIVIALGSVIDPQPCDALDADHDGMVQIAELILGVNNALSGCPPALTIVTPTDNMLVLAGTVAAQITLPAGVDGDTIALDLDGTNVTGQFDISSTQASGNLLDVTVGRHRLTARAELNGQALSTAVHFEAIPLNNPDECEVLNDAECLLPYPSSRFLVADATTATGFRVHIPAAGLPMPIGPPISPDPLNQLDGFSPTVQILMHFPQGVDPERSDASRLLAAGCCGQPAGPPWIDTRTYDGRSLDADSPSVLLDADTGERILHWLENDAHADGNPGRQALIMRPGESLAPGHHYIVAMRNLKTAAGNSVVGGEAFTALRDRRPTNIAALESRRAAMESIFTTLANHGVARAELVLAFDFVVQSDHQLTSAMLSMRDQAFAWLDQVQAIPDQVTFTVTNVQDSDCTAPGAIVWRNVTGTFQSPLFLTKDPNQDGVGFLNLDAQGVPVQNGVTDARFSVSIPCSLLAADAPPAHPIVLGHGLFGSGSDMTTLVPQLAGKVVPWTYIAGATDWRGLSSLDVQWVATEIVGFGSSQLNNFPGLPDRLRQGMLNTLVLARMMKLGLFNRDADVFATPAHTPVFADKDTEMYYYGISLGGIMGTFFSALTPDVQRFGVDVPSINFSCLLQRSTDFGAFETLVESIGITDPLQILLGLQLLHELWVAGEPAGYARHITSDPLPGSGDAKHILLTAAWLDKQVSNQCTEVEARTLKLPNLTPASLQRRLQGIPDRDGPLDSAYVMFDTGAFDLFNPAEQQFIPPLANLIPSDKCDPHGDRPTIPAGIKMLANFLQPGGQVVNMCNGICDAGEPDEIAGGAAAPCDPLAP